MRSSRSKKKAATLCPHCSGTLVFLDRSRDKSSNTATQAWLSIAEMLRKRGFEGDPLTLKVRTNHDKGTRGSYRFLVIDPKESKPRKPKRRKSTAAAKTTARKRTTTKKKAVRKTVARRRKK